MKKTTKKKARKKATIRPSRPKRPKARATPRPARRPAMDPDAMMRMWQTAMTPGPGHERLEPMVGTFHARTTFTMARGAEPSVSEGTSENRWVLGGRYLEQSYRGMSMGMPFEGIGYTGYDNVQKRYVGTWMDTFGTGLMTSVGVGKPSERGMEFEASAHEPSGKRIAFLCKITIQDRDHHSYEMWTKGPNRYRSMLVEYTRT